MPAALPASWHRRTLIKPGPAHSTNGHFTLAMISLFNNKTEAAIIAATVATAYILHKAFKNSRKSYSTRSLRGPPSPSFLTGHQDAIIDYDIDQLEGWLKEYGSVFRIDSYFPFESKGLCVVDPKAVAFITSRSLEFSKPRTVTQVLMSWGGLGLFTAEGEAHKKQVRIRTRCTYVYRGYQRQLF